MSALGLPDGGTRMKAYEVIEKYGWMQGEYARRIDGTPCGPGDPEAVVFCLAGAVIRAYTYRSLTAQEKLASLLGHRLAVWNDAPWRRKDHVIELLRAFDI